MRTFIKWLGNKQRYMNHIIPLLPAKFNNYIEPFLGSGALLLHLQPSQFIVNDLNQDLISVWNVVKHNPELVIHHFKNFAKKFKTRSRDSKKKFCRELTETLNHRNAEERSLDFLLMMQCCYMGVLKKKGIFYFYGMDPHIYMDNKCFFLTSKYYDNIQKVSQFLQNPKNKIFNTDYKIILKKSKPGDFVFLDPPYIENDQDYNFEYNTGEQLDYSFIQELAHQLMLLDLKGVQWMMTQADTPQIKQLFQKYYISEFPVFRSRSRTHKNELIIRNYLK